jgi:hypothetical protein
MIVAPSQLIVITRDQTNTSGLPEANTHTAKLWKNGVETAETVTPVATATTGVYSFAFTIPADAAQYDVWSIRVVDGDGFPSTVWEGVTGPIAAELDSGGAGGTTTIVTLQAVAGISPGVIVGPSEPLVIGDDYLTSLNRSVRINLLDANGDPATVVFGSKSLADVDCTIQLLLHKSGKPSTTAVIVGTCTFNAAVGAVPPYLIVEFPKAETALATPGAYDMQAEAKWPAPGNEVVTFAPYGQLQFTKDIARRP